MLGAEMMLKAFGVDPEVMKKTAEQFTVGVQVFREQLTRIEGHVLTVETRMNELGRMLAEIDRRLWVLESALVKTESELEGNEAWKKKQALKAQSQVLRLK